MCIYVIKIYSIHVCLYIYNIHLSTYVCMDIFIYVYTYANICIPNICIHVYAYIHIILPVQGTPWRELSPIRNNDVKTQRYLNQFPNTWQPAERLAEQRSQQSPKVSFDL
jgi:hypothetical protein